uniref:YHS domain-containing protein n=1 Tax=uncultured Armatimonadetes bacterium TaxID=157466 RepID=A0A6J4JQH4_9BACT|nr:hypothetical protein AVDCRST_MAG63-3867 [uncultured Armatimonadetes bacterium]
MQDRKPVTRLLAAAVAFAATAQRASAHEKWFHSTDTFPLRPDLVFRPLPLAFIGGVLLATLAGWLFWRSRGSRGFVPGPETFGTTDERRALLFGLAPLMLAIHLAVPLLVNGVQGNLFSPDNPLPAPWKYFLGLGQVGIALALFYGALTRLAALALAALWGAGLFLVGPEPMLDNLFYLGFAAFFYLAGRGPFSVDRLLLPRLEPPAELLRRAVPALRVGLGLSLIVVAFTEKFANVPLALAFLEKYPLNFTPAFGMPLPNEVFVLCAGAVELLVGLWLLFGIFPREIVLIAWIPINMTLTIFNWTELIGHLPIYGIMGVLLVWNATREDADLWVRGLRETLLPAQGTEVGQDPLRPRRAAAVTVGLVLLAALGVGSLRVANAAREQRPAPAHDHTGHDHAEHAAAAPAPTTAERELFLTAGGLYTDADIRANGSKTPAQRYHGVMAQHNKNPKPGAYVCPISGTAANPRFTWTIAGRGYRFCCPPCIGEFVQQAKTDPDSIRPPDEYRKKN